MLVVVLTVELDDEFFVTVVVEVEDEGGAFVVGTLGAFGPPKVWPTPIGCLGAGRPAPEKLLPPCDAETGSEHRSKTNSTSEKFAFMGNPPWPMAENQ